MEKQIQELKEELNRRKCELEGIKYAHEIEIECYQTEIYDVKNVIQSIYLVSELSRNKL